MLTLVMKYDLKNCFRRALSLLGTLFVISAFAMGLLYFALSLFGSVVSIVLTALYFLCVLTMGFMFFLLLSLGAVCYYRTLFTDEGYLSMSIPMKTSRLVNAKILSVLVYECVILLAGVIAFGISSFLPAALYDSEKLLLILRAMVTVATDGIETSSAGVVLLLLGFFSKLIAQSVILLSSVTVGCVTASKHRAIVSLGLFFGVNATLGIAEIIVSYIIEGAVEDSLIALILPLLCELLLTLVACIIIYFISMHLMKKRFNIA